MGSNDGILGNGPCRIHVGCCRPGSLGRVFSSLRPFNPGPPPYRPIRSEPPIFSPELRLSSVGAIGDADGMEFERQVSVWTCRFSGLNPIQVADRTRPSAVIDWPPKSRFPLAAVHGIADLQRKGRSDNSSASHGEKEQTITSRRRRFPGQVRRCCRLVAERVQSIFPSRHHGS